MPSSDLDPRTVFALVCALAAAAPAQQGGEAAPTAGRLRAIRVETGNVFAATDVDGRLLPGLINTVHWTPRTEVIWRELWFRPGDRIDAATAAELERNLRGLGLFAAVSVVLTPADVDGEVDLVITTRDRLSLFFGGGGSYVGGVTGINVAVGEGNLFGSGDRLVGSFRRSSDGQYRGTLDYTDLHLLDSWVNGDLRLSRTDVGDGIAFELDRPFKHLDDPVSWRVAAAHDELETDYYRAGDVVATVPRRAGSLTGSVQWGDGPRDARRAVGVTATFGVDQYGTATGALGPDQRVPGDARSALIGGTLTLDWIDGYRKVTGLDTLGYVQDLTLGERVSLLAGGRYRDEDGRGGELEPELHLGCGWAAEPADRLFVNLGLSAVGRWHGDAPAGWLLSARAQGFRMWNDTFTSAASTVFDAAEEREGLAPQLTLGEDNGLRGYDARILAGTRRVRLNLEQRCDTGVEFWTLHLGLTGFADAGWVGDGGRLGAPVRSAGVGLRIGSPSLLGGGLLRIDVAHAFDDVLGNGSDWSASVSMGQVFGFGGVASGIAVR